IREMFQTCRSATLSESERTIKLSEGRDDYPSAALPLYLLEGVPELWIPYQTDTPNSYRLINSPSTRSCMRSVLEKQIVRRTNRLIRVRILMCLLSIFCVLAFPTSCCSASRCRS